MKDEEVKTDKENNYIINIIKPTLNGENKNSNNQNLLSLNGRTPKRKKSKLQDKMQSSYCVKKYINESGSNGAMILKEHNLSKSLKNVNSIESPSRPKNEKKESFSNLENISNIEKVSKNEIKNPHSKFDINHNINYNININNNPNDLLNLLKLTNKLYNDDDHLQKEIPTKKIDINNLTNFDKNLKDDSNKKKLYIQFGLDNRGKRGFQSAIEMETNNNKNKDNFSKYIEVKNEYAKENEDEQKINSSELEENINFYNKNFNNENGVVKSPIIKSKSNKKKKNKNKNKITKETVNKEKCETNQNVRQSINLNKEEIKKNNTIKSNKSKEKVKNIVKEEEIKIDDCNKDEEKKKKKFNFFKCFCCLNSELNDSK